MMARESSERRDPDGGRRPGVSIIVPVLDEAPRLGASLRALQALVADARPRVDIIVVDGGSRDDTVAQARTAGARVITAPRGRASQMNAGAALARGEVLLFLHADTTLPANTLDEIGRARAAGHDWGRFDVAIAGTSPWLRLIGAAMNLRSRWSSIATGDQAIFVSRQVFTALGGFPALPLMEDIALCQRLRRQGAPYNSRARVITSGRRWEQHGVWTTVWLMWRLRLAYFFGADPARLARRYGYRAPAVANAPDSTPGGAPEQAPEVGRAAAPDEALADGHAPIGIAILAKAPIAGYAKTRLAPLLGEQGAANLQQRLLRHSVSAALAARVGPVVLWGAPDAEHPALRACAALGPLTLRAQPAGDLGRRMLAAAEPGAGTIGTLIIGTDCPALDAVVLRRAAQALRQHAAVLVPAEDGGYVLIGLRRPLAALFAGVDWGSDQVLAATRQRLRAAGLGWEELPSLWDVDVAADYARLVAAFPEFAAEPAAERRAG